MGFYPRDIRKALFLNAIEIIPVFYETPFFTGRRSLAGSVISYGKLRLYTRGYTVTTVYDIQSYFSFRVMDRRFSPVTTPSGLVFSYLNNHRKFFQLLRSGVSARFFIKNREYLTINTRCRNAYLY